MSAETLAASTGIVLSLFSSYLPGWSKWYSDLTSDYKRLIMALLLLIVAVGSFLLSCSGYGSQFNIDTTCNPNGFISLVQIYIAALVANQAVYAITKN
jgi:hypothetical protein